MKKLISMAMSLVMTIAMLTGCGNSQDVYRLIKVNSFEGAVTVEREEKTDVFEGMQLVSEDSVEVGEASLLELLADSDKHIVAEANTVFKVTSSGTEKSGNITIDLLYGKSLFTIDNKLPDGSTFEVNTPNASLSVRGTIFSVDYDPETNETKVEVEEGVVAVAGANGTTTLEQGQSIIVTSAGIPYPNESAPDINTDTGTIAGTNISDGTASEPVEVKLLFDIKRTYQLTGDNSYKTQSANYTITTVGSSDMGASLGIPVEDTYYNDLSQSENPYLTGLLNELKTYIEPNSDYINEFFDANQKELIQRHKELGNDYYANFVYLDWFPDTITTTNETGTYKLTITTAKMSLIITEAKGNYSTDEFISDYYIEVDPLTEEESAFHCNSLAIFFYGTVEKLS